MLQLATKWNQQPPQLAKFCYKTESQRNYALEFSTDKSFKNPAIRLCLEICINYSLIKHNRALKDYF